MGESQDRLAARRRTSRWVLPWGTVTSLLALLLLVDPGGLSTRPSIGIALRHGTEALLVSGLLLLALTPAAGSVRRSWLIWTAVAGAVLAVVQWLPTPLDLHPVVPWDMYTVPSSRVPWTEWVVVASDGREEPAPFDAVVPTPRRPFIDQLDPWVDRAAAGDAAAAAILHETISGVVTSADYPTTARVEARRCEIAVPSPERRPACSTAYVVQLGGG